MKTISRETLELVLQSFESVSKDETRRNISGVKLGRDDKHRSIIESTDGYIFNRHFVDSVLFLGDLKEIIIDQKAKSYIKNLLTNNKYNREFLASVDVDKQVIVFSTQDGRDSVVAPLVQSDFPRLDHFIPDEQQLEKYFEININPDLLMKLFKSMSKEKSTHRKAVKLRISKDNNMSPIIVSTSGDNIGLLMPRRG
jgi:hypothetical protein